MTAIIPVLVGLAFLGWVAVPLLKREEELPPDLPPGEQLEDRREAMVDNIRDLDFEFAMGKLTEGDYREIRQGMVQEAAGVMRELDVAGRDQALDRWIEAEVKARRADPLASGAGAAGEVPCPGCSRANPRGSRFCDGCGAALAAPACRACGERLRPDARFCGACGAGL